jgi:SOS-response transcriptional repressor LexA
MIAITVKQLATLRAIKMLRARLGYPPSYPELCEALGLRSKNTISYRLNALADMGLIVYDPGKSRTVGLTSEGKRMIA